MDSYTILSLAVDLNTKYLVKMTNTHVKGVGDIRNNNAGIRKGLNAIVGENLNKGYLSVDILGLRNESTGKVLWAEPGLVV